MKTKIIYQTHIEQIKLKNKLFVLESIKNLDQAIDQLCEQFSDDESSDPLSEELSPYFGILWPSSIGLAKYMVEKFDSLNGLSILEIGCGLGLPSLVAHHLKGNVLATDYHPDVEYFFQRNCRHSSMEKINYKRWNWREKTEINEKYDVVLGSDILYESKHPKEVSRTLLNLVKPKGIIILSDPGRAYLQSYLELLKDHGLNVEVRVVNASPKDKVFIVEIKT